MCDKKLDYTTLSKKDKLVLHPLQHHKTHSDPIIVEYGKGVWLYTVDGKRIMDAFAGMWNVNIGYGNVEVSEAAYKQMCKMAYMSNFSGTTTIPLIELGEKLAGYAYPKLNTTFFTSGGSEANDSAFKTMNYYWKRMGKPSKTKVIGLRNGFHGFTVASTNATGIEKFWHMFGRIPGFVHIPAPYPYRYEGEVKEGETVGQAASRVLEETILREGPENVGGFIAEPVQGVGGGIIPPEDYFPRVREICDKYEVLLISDEVITGFGRTGKRFGLNNWGIQPDILSFAKGVTSGYLPLGGIQVSDSINEVIQNAPLEDAWLHGYTYSGHATSCAVALKNLEIIERDNLLENVNKMGNRLNNGLQKFKELCCVGEIRNLGLLVAIELVKNKDTREPDLLLAARVFKECLEKGVRLRALGNSIAIAPPFIINEDEIDQIIEVIGEVLSTN